MITKVLSLLAAVLMAGTIAHVLAHQEPSSTLPDLQIHAEPFAAPFEHSICGSGIIEPENDAVEVAAPVAGVVAEVYVQPGDTVVEGEPLFRLDDRHLLAERGRRTAALQRARVELDRLAQPVRAELLAVKEAAVAAARVDLDRAEEVFHRITSLTAQGAAGDEELREARYRLDSARSQLAMVVKDFELLQAGTWDHDLEVARASIREAETSLAQIDAEIERLMVRAPMEADVLQANVQAGEAVGEPGHPAPMVLGKRHHMYIRVDIDEFDLERFDPQAPAVGVPKGDTGRFFSLEFVRVEPLVIEKHSLTGISRERVDTRVLQVVYRLPEPRGRLYYGQQVYVCTEGSPEPTPLQPKMFAGIRDQDREVGHP